PFQPEHISHSQLSLWQLCPKQWEYVYIQKMRRSSNGNLILGSCYHQALEENFKRKMELGHDLDYDICADYFSTIWDKSVASSWNINWNDKDPGVLKDLGFALLDKYLETVAPAIIPQCVELEIEKEFEDTSFVIRIDLIDMNGVVIDHKTSSKSYTQADVDKDMQASASAFMLDRPIVFQNHVAVKTRNPQIQIVKTYRTDLDVSWWYRKAVAILHHMKTGYAPPNEDGWWCNPNYCDFYDECRKDLARSIS
ncbi:MAG: PD-(D/E)XK nuclease family protein, partial [Dehalococcoidales bacterium]|nr:PD-(D/E)XK nuclease family protein [Dehalococcoidales bacterium]